MNKAFNALFDFNEATVVGNVGDLAEQPGLRRITTRQIMPGIITQLLDTQRYALAFTIEFQDLGLESISKILNTSKM